MSIESDLLEDIDLSDIVLQLCRKQVRQEVLLVGNKFSILSNMSNVGSRCRLFLDIWSEYYELQLCDPTVPSHNFYAMFMSL